MNELAPNLFQALSKKDYNTVLALLKLDRNILREIFEDQDVICANKNEFLTMFLELVNQYPDVITLVSELELIKLAKIANKNVIQRILQIPLLQHVLTAKKCCILTCCYHALMYIAAMCQNPNADQEFLMNMLNSRCFQRDELFNSLTLQEVISSVLKNSNADKSIFITLFNLRCLQTENPFNTAILGVIISRPSCRRDFIFEILSVKYRHLITAYKLVVIAKNEHANPEILWKILSPDYAKFLTNNILVAIASNKNSTAKILWQISSPMYKHLLRSNVLAAVADNHNSDPSLLRRVLLLREVFYRKDLLIKVASNQNANKEILCDLLTVSNDKLVVKAIAAHRNADIEIHRIILNKIQKINLPLDIILSIVLNPKAKTAILSEILDNINIIHSNTKVVAGTTQKTIDKMIVAIVQGIAAHKNANETMLKDILYQHQQYLNVVIILRIAANPNANIQMLREILYGKYKSYLNLGIIINIAKNCNSDQKIIEDILYGKYSRYLSPEILISIASDPNANDMMLRNIFVGKCMSAWFAGCSLDVTLDMLIKHKASSHAIMSVLSCYSVNEIEKHPLFISLLRYKEVMYIESRFTFLKALPNSILSFSKQIHHVLNFIDFKDNNRNSLFFGSYDKYFLQKNPNPSGDNFKDVYELLPLSSVFVTVSDRIVAARNIRHALLI